MNTEQPGRYPSVSTLVRPDNPKPVEVIPEPEPRPARPRPWLKASYFLVLIALLVGGVYLIHRGFATRAETQAKPKTPPVVPVQVAKATSGTMPVTLAGVGNVTAFSTVPVTSQVPGQLDRVFFTQGQFVRKGQPLFTIDSRQYAASVRQVEANVARDESAVAQAERNVARDSAAVRQAEANLAKDASQQKFEQGERNRYGGLVHQGFVTREQYEQVRANAGSYDALLRADQAAIATSEASRSADEAAVGSAQATTRSDQAALQNAQVQLSYTDIRAPIDGRTGSLTVYQGSIVAGNGASPLVTIDQITPIYVSFAVPERYLPEIRAYQERHPLPVQMSLAPGQSPEKGTITFIDNSVDTTTGTITLRATFPNKLHRLWPGQFATVQLLLHEIKHAVMVPSQAVQPGQQGSYVFVVKPDMTVDSRTVQIEESLGDYTVIKSGVKPGETVVTDGQMQLQPGAKVNVVTATGRKAPAAVVPGMAPASRPQVLGPAGNRSPASPSAATALSAPSSAASPYK